MKNVRTGRTFWYPSICYYFPYYNGSFFSNQLLLGKLTECYQPFFDQSPKTSWKHTLITTNGHTATVCLHLKQPRYCPLCHSYKSLRKGYSDLQKVLHSSCLQFPREFFHSPEIKSVQKLEVLTCDPNWMSPKLVSTPTNFRELLSLWYSK